MPNPDQIPYVKLIKSANLPDEWTDVPILGDLWEAGNAVIDFIESDCRPGWDVYLETLFPAAGELFLALVAFDLDDVLRGYFRPGGGRGFGGLGRASRRFPRLTKAQRARGALRGGIPEMGELLGRNIPGARFFRGRNVGAAERWAWRLDGIAQRGLWWWMVADLGSDFVIHWTTGILESEECDGSLVAGFTREGGSPVIPIDPNLNDMLALNLVEEYGPITSQASHVFVPAGFKATIWCACKANTTPLWAPVDARVGFYDPTAGGGEIAGSNWTRLPEASPGVELGASCTVVGPKTVAWGGSATDVNFASDWEVHGILKQLPA